MKRFFVPAIILMMALLVITGSSVLAEEPAVPVVYCTNAAIDGAEVVALSGEQELTAKAVVPEGYAVANWKVGGVLMDTDAEEITFTASTTTGVECILREKLIVKTINAEMQFVTANNKARGETFTEFCFEPTYTQPLTGEEISDGTITVFVKAVVPKGKTFDHWLINGVPYYPENVKMLAFRVEDLDEPTVYEVVFKGGSKATPKPTVEDNDPPAEKYWNVTCDGCTFTGGGYTNARSGRVKDGTKITVTGDQDSHPDNGFGTYTPYTEREYFENDDPNEPGEWVEFELWKFEKQGGRTITATITSDRHFKYYLVVN